MGMDFSKMRSYYLLKITFSKKYGSMIQTGCNVSLNKYCVYYTMYVFAAQSKV